MSVKIQINSLEALERLIGGNSQMEIEIRGTIVQQFVKKHLKAIANEEMIKNAEYTIRTELKENFVTLVKEYGKTKLIFNEDTRVELKKWIHDLAKEEFIQIASEALAPQQKIKMVNDSIDIASNRIVSELTDENLKLRIDALADKKIKEWLGIK